MRDLRREAGTAARALEFLILCASSTAEVIGAVPSEFDLDKALWTIPAKRMKAAKERRVPLSLRAVAIVREQLKLEEIYVFPGLRRNKPLSKIAMLRLLEDMGRDDLTVNGFRWTFWDWVAKQTAYSLEVPEIALSRTVSAKEKTTHRKADLFQKRRRLAVTWAKFCLQDDKSGKIINERKAR